MPVIGHKENIPTLLKSSVYLIQITDGTKGRNVPDPLPVYGICYFYRVGISAFPNQSFYLISPDLILDLIQNILLFGASNTISSASLT